MTPKPFTYYIWRNKLWNKRTTRKHANNFYKSPPRDSQQQVWEKKVVKEKRKNATMEALFFSFCLHCAHSFSFLFFLGLYLEWSLVLRPSLCYGLPMFYFYKWEDHFSREIFWEKNLQKISISVLQFFFSRFCRVLVFPVCRNYLSNFIKVFR